MGCAHKQNQNGFTLVEIAIVMIIIGLLIGGTFGGLKLVENMRMQKVGQDLASIESAALTFKDTYGRLPGDMLNTAARLPNCTVAPCATSGNGDRRLDSALAWTATIADTNERFTFWSQLTAADLVGLKVKNTTDLTFGEGQPESPMDFGYRMIYPSFISTNRHAVMLTSSPSGALGGLTPEEMILPASTAQQLDRKIDDGLPQGGRLWVYGSCYTGAYGPAGRYDISINTGDCGATYSMRF